MKGEEFQQTAEHAHITEGICKELVCGQQRKRKRAQNCKQEKEIRACNDVKRLEQRTDALFHDCSKQCCLDRGCHQRQQQCEEQSFFPTHLEKD